MTQIETVRLVCGRWLTLFAVGASMLIAAAALLAGLRHGLAIAAVGAGTAAAAGGAWLLAPTAPETRIINTLCLCTVAALGLAFAEGTPLVIDMHMSFFALLAMSAAWCCWRALVVGALFIVVHHLMFNHFYPAAVFPAASDLSRVLLHGGIVAVEVVALVGLTTLLARSFARTDSALEQTAAAEAAAREAAEAHDRRANREEEARRGLQAEIDRFRADMAGLVARIGETAGALDATSAKLDIASSTSTRTARDAQERASNSVEEVARVAASAGALVESLAEVTERMNDAARMAAAGVDVASASARELERHETVMKEIDGVVRLIRSFADQTNLLALNATIEAARAGESGRGFAIVAQEVKTLADQTNRAVDTIVEHVSQMRGASEAMAQVVRGMAGSMVSVDAHARAILNAVVEQQAAAADISAASGLVAGNARTMGDFVESASTSTADTNQAARDVMSASAAVKSASGELQVRVESFMRALKAA